MEGSLDQHAIHLQVADEGGALTLGGLSQCPTYLSGMSKADVQKEFKKQIDVFVSEGLDFLLCEVSLLLGGTKKRENINSHPLIPPF